MIRRCGIVLLCLGVSSSWGQSVSDKFQVEMELFDLQTEQSIYYKFDPAKNAPPHEKPQVINLLRWQSFKAERNTSILVRSSIKNEVSSVFVRFQGGDGGVEMKYACGPDTEIMPSATFNIYVQEKLRYEARITHNCSPPTRIED